MRIVDNSLMLLQYKRFMFMSPLKVLVERTLRLLHRHPEWTPAYYRLKSTQSGHCYEICPEMCEMIFSREVRLIIKQRRWWGQTCWSDAPEVRCSPSLPAPTSSLVLLPDQTLCKCIWNSFTTRPSCWVTWPVLFSWLKGKSSKRCTCVCDC